VRRIGGWLVAYEAGHGGAAARALPVSVDRYRAQGDPGPIWLWPAGAADFAYTVRIALSLGRREPAEQAVAAAERRAKGADDALSSAVALDARGLLEADPAVIASALELFGGSRRSLVRANAHEDLGRLATDGGRVNVARKHLEAALALYVASGAEHDPARVRARLRELGVGKLHGDPHEDVGLERWRELSPMELKVTRLVAEGATNREVAERLFVSPHTVSTHLQNTFAKVGGSFAG
jgi:DNA-binding CsgD family transcriptional regulator